jgi:hypothetical protein
MLTAAAFQLNGFGPLTAVAVTRQFGIQDDTELETHLHRLLDILEPATSAIWGLTRDR